MLHFTWFINEEKHSFEKYLGKKNKLESLINIKCLVKTDWMKIWQKVGDTLNSALVVTAAKKGFGLHMLASTQTANVHLIVLKALSSFWIGLHNSAHYILAIKMLAMFLVVWSNYCKFFIEKKLKRTLHIILVYLFPIFSTHNNIRSVLIYTNNNIYSIYHSFLCTLLPIKLQMYISVDF